MDLFTIQMEESLKRTAPLADRMRPRELSEFIGQSHFVGPGKYINRVVEADRIPSMIFYGPPGVGKTTLAKLISRQGSHPFTELSAVSSGIKELREVLGNAEENLKMTGRGTVLFIDEIHRYNKSQQDALLPYVERGKIILIGATTENPFFEVNKALVSRCQILNFHPLREEELVELMVRALSDGERGFGKVPVILSDDAVRYLVVQSQGDGRALLNALEIAVLTTPEEEGQVKITLEVIQDCMQQKKVKYDKGGADHYDTISAFIKSLRGSDPDGALFWMAKMLEGGEDPKFIARRMIILASEDVGNGDPAALPLAVAAFDAVNIVGMPEGRIALAQAATYLACAEKSNRAYLAVDRAIQRVRAGGLPEVPMYLREPHNPRVKAEKERGYLYPHNYPGAFVKQSYLPQEFENDVFYVPSQRGGEREMRQRQEKRWEKDYPQEE